MIKSSTKRVRMSPAEERYLDAAVHADPDSPNFSVLMGRAWRMYCGDLVKRGLIAKLPPALKDGRTKQRRNSIKKAA